MISKQKPFSLGLGILVVTLVSAGLSGCLKTRAQLRDEGGSTAGDEIVRPASAPAPVKDGNRYVIDELKGEITRLTGRLEDLERAQKQGADAGTREEIKKLENRVIELEQAQLQLLETIKRLQETPPPPADPTETFNRGVRLFESGDFEGAATALSAYLSSPKNTKYAEAATFFRAEAYYNLKQHKKAIVDYSKFPEKFSKSKRVPAALYKIGLSFEALGMKEDSKGFYQELIDKYPKAAETSKARARLKK